MALDKAGLISDIIEAQDASRGASDPTTSRQIFASKLAEAIDKYVKTGEVVTVGSATTQKGSMT